MDNTQCFPHDEEWIIQALENLSRGHDLQETSSSSEGEIFLNLMTKEEMMGKDFDFVKSQVCRECDDVIGLVNIACTFCKVLYHPECATQRVVGDFFCSQKCKRSATKISNKRKRDSDSEEEEDYTRISHVRSSLQDFDVDDETYSPDECKKSPVKSRRISAKKPRWTSEEDAKLIELKRKFGDLSWAKISENMEDRTSSQCYQRWHRVLNPAILKGPWSKEETDILARIVIEMENDKISWSQVAKHIPGRTDIQCRYQYLKLVRSGKQKFLRKSGGASHEERRNPHRVNRKRSSKDQVDNIPDSDSEILDEEEIEDEISS